MEITGTLLDGQITDIDLTPIFYANMISVYDIAKEAYEEYHNTSGYTHPTLSEINDASIWKCKKVIFPVDVSTNYNWDSGGTPFTTLAYGTTNASGGYMEYDFTKNDVYCESADYNSPDYFVDDCVTLFYYTNETASSNTPVVRAAPVNPPANTYDTSVCLYFPPIIYYQARNDEDINNFNYTPVIKNVNTTITSDYVSLQTHPYSNSGYTFEYSDFNINNTATYSWVDSLGNCDLNHDPLNSNTYSPSSTYTKTAPKYIIGFKKDGLSFFTRDGIQCHHEYNTSYDGWVEFMMEVVTRGTITYDSINYYGSYHVNKLKIRIIKLKLASDIGEQKFFIGSKYPNDIKITNSSGALVPVKEVWLGSVKVWPCGYDFNDPNATTNANLRFKLIFQGFNFYLTSISEEKIGNGITDGSVFVSIGYIINRTNVSSAPYTYNVHEASYHNDPSINSGTFQCCGVAARFTSPKPTTGSIINNILELSYNIPKEYCITFDGGNNQDLQHSLTRNCSTDYGNPPACHRFFKDINAFNLITFNFYFYCAHPILTSNSEYYTNIARDSDISNAKDIYSNSSFSDKKMKIGSENYYNMIDIYRLGSKELMSKDNIIYKGARVDKWKDLPRNSIINTYDTDASVNNSDICKGYLNTISRGPYFLGGITDTITEIPFAVNIYVPPQKTNSYYNNNSGGDFGGCDPSIKQGTCVKYHNFGSELWGAPPITTENISSTSIYTIGKTPHSDIGGWKSDTTHPYAKLYKEQDVFINDNENDNLRIGIKVLESNNTSNNYNKVQLYIAKDCHTQIITEKQEAHIWNGYSEEGLNIIDYYGKAPSVTNTEFNNDSSIWDETENYNIPPNNSDNNYFYSRSRSITTGQYTLLAAPQKARNNGQLEINIQIKKTWKHDHISYAVIAGGTGSSTPIHTVGTVGFNYTYCDEDKVIVEINQLPITYSAGNTLPTINYKTYVVGGTVSSFGGYSHNNYYDPSIN